jgi:hypothetical protein
VRMDGTHPSRLGGQFCFLQHCMPASQRLNYNVRLTASGRPCLGLGATVRPDAP